MDSTIMLNIFVNSPLEFKLPKERRSKQAKEYLEGTSNNPGLRDWSMRKISQQNEIYKNNRPEPKIYTEEQKTKIFKLRNSMKDEVSKMDKGFPNRASFFHFILKTLVLLRMIDLIDENKSSAALQSILSKFSDNGLWETIRYCELFTRIVQEEDIKDFSRGKQLRIVLNSIEHNTFIVMMDRCLVNV